jgi:hypothetical protein
VITQGTYELTSQRLQQFNTIIIDMAQFLDSSELQKSACKAVHMIANKCSHAGDYLGAEGTCEAVIAALFKHPTNTSVAKWGLSAVTALVQCKPVHIHAIDDDNSARLHDAGVCNTIATIMQKSGSNREVLIHAYKAMSELFNVSSATATRLLQAGVHTTVTIAITHHMSNADLVINGTSVLNWLSHHSTTQMKTAMGIDGVCQILPDNTSTYQQLRYST